jgi:hypothetical protein
VDFNLRFRLLSWKAAACPTTPAGVKDPLFCLLAKVRARLCWCKADARRVIYDRVNGKLAKPAEWVQEVQEPMRTERLLHQIVRFRRSNAADTLDAYQFTFFTRANGARMPNLAFDHFGMTIQMSTAVILSWGRNSPAGMDRVTTQLVILLSLQFINCSYCFLLFPAVDRIISVLQSAQFGLEGARTTLLLVQHHVPAVAPQLLDASFNLSLCALFLPLSVKFYDGVVVHLVKLYLGGKLNWSGVVLSLSVFAISLQDTIKAMTLSEDAGDARLVGSQVETALKSAKRAHDQGIAHRIQKVDAASVSATVEDGADANACNEQERQTRLSRREQSFRALPPNMPPAGVASANGIADMESMSLHLAYTRASTAANRASTAVDEDGGADAGGDD